MKKNLFLMLGLGAMLLTSCDQDITNEIYLPGSGGSVTVADSTRTSYLSINTSIAPSGSLTRAVNDAWENGDAVGGYADYASGSSWFTNAKFVRKDNSSQFVSEIPYYYQDQETCNVKAYYPYNASVTSSNPDIAFTCSSTAIPQKQKEVDFMYATANTRWATAPNLVFQHKMTRVIFNVIAGDGFTGTQNGGKASSELITGDFTLWAVGDGAFNTRSGVVTPGTSFTTFHLTGTGNSTAGVAHCITFELILPPQSTNNIEFQLVTDTGISITSVIANECSHTRWDAGYTYTYNVVCNKESFNILSSSIKPWVNSSEETLVPTE